MLTSSNEPTSEKRKAVELRSADDLIGTAIGNYELKAVLGRGGMGVVYLAEHPLIGKKVAIKVLHAELSEDEEYTGRFFDEARAVNSIAHPHIVDIIDYGVLGAGSTRTVYLTMELLEGRSLSRLLKQDGPLAPERATAITRQVAGALAASHDRGVIHRDLKPDNIMLVQRGELRDFVKVLDFGIAKLEDGKGSARTQIGMVLGTPQYVAPEQCDGHTAVDGRADVYALGVVLYRLLSGVLPYPGKGFAEVIRKQLAGPPAPPSSLVEEVPPALDAVVLKALQYEPRDRFQSMDELRQALADPQAFLAEEDPESETTTRAGVLRAGDTSGASSETGSSQVSSTTAVLAGARSTEPDPGTRSRSRRWLPVALAMAVGIAVAGVGVRQLQHSATTSTGDDQGDRAGAVPAPAALAPGSVGENGSNATDRGDSSHTTDGVAPQIVTLTVRSNPPAADVYLGDDAEPRGRTPLPLELKPKDGLRITVKREGYRTETRVLDLRRDTGVTLRLHAGSTATVPEPIADAEDTTEPSRDEEPRAKSPRTKRSRTKRRSRRTSRDAKKSAGDADTNNATGPGSTTPNMDADDLMPL